MALPGRRSRNQTKVGVQPEVQCFRLVASQRLGHPWTSFDELLGRAGGNQLAKSSAEPEVISARRGGLLIYIQRTKSSGRAHNETGCSEELLSWLAPFAKLAGDANQPFQCSSWGMASTAHLPKR